MPVKKIPYPAPSKSYQDLVRKLAKELLQDSPNGPEIIEEEQRSGSLAVHVIWDLWSKTSHEERGRIIMDAYKKQRAADVLRISLVVGLTRDEAKRLGISA